MKFEAINKELKIAACGLADLTMEQVQSFLKQWEEGASVEDREALAKEAPEMLQQTIHVLKNSLTWRKVDRDIYKAEKNYIDDSDRITVREIIARSDDKVGAAYIAFRYGVMCGKRAERARKKRTA